MHRAPRLHWITGPTCLQCQMDEVLQHGQLQPKALQTDMDVVKCKAAAAETEGVHVVQDLPRGRYHPNLPRPPFRRAQCTSFAYRVGDHHMADSPIPSMRRRCK